MFYLWEWMVTWQHACSWAECGCECPCRWRTFCSGPGRSHPDDPGLGSRSWWTAPLETRSSLQTSLHQAMSLNCHRENTEEGRVILFKSSKTKPFQIWWPKWNILKTHVNNSNWCQFDGWGLISLASKYNPVKWLFEKHKCLIMGHRERVNKH